MLPNIKKKQPLGTTVARSVTNNSDTGDVIQDLTIDHAVDNSKALHVWLPGGATNTTTVLYHNDPALIEDEPQHSDASKGSARDNEICMTGLYVTYPSNSKDADAAGPAAVSQDWDGPS